jgi:hypothetical protein
MSARGRQGSIPDLTYTSNLIRRNRHAPQNFCEFFQVAQNIGLIGPLIAFAVRLELRSLHRNRGSSA